MLHLFQFVFHQLVQVPPLLLIKNLSSALPPISFPPRPRAKEPLIQLLPEDSIKGKFFLAAYAIQKSPDSQLRCMGSENLCPSSILPRWMAASLHSRSTFRNPFILFRPCLYPVWPVLRLLEEKTPRRRVGELHRCGIGEFPVDNTNDL